MPTPTELLAYGQAAIYFAIAFFILMVGVRTFLNR